MCIRDRFSTNPKSFNFFPNEVFANFDKVASALDEHFSSFGFSAKVRRVSTALSKRSVIGSYWKIVRCSDAVVTTREREFV